MDTADLALLVADLRSEGSDVAEVEVKRAARGYPEDLAPTLSAFGNTPGGGLIVFGIDESSGFGAVGVYDAVACKKAIAASARQAVDPPLVVSTSEVNFEGTQVVVAVVNELPASAKPCKVKASGRAYLRSYDGDYALSELEEQAFIANRDTPRFDEQPVPGATFEDLDAALVEQYYVVATSSSAALQRFDRAELLFRTGVLVGDSRVPTVAGLLSLGIYPQQYLPNLVIRASVAPGPSDPPGTRVSDSRRFDGPLPIMLDEAVRWVSRNTRTRIRFGEDGIGRDEAEYPIEAVRELLSNALVHRDLGPYAMNEAITLRLLPDKLVLSNPGGLYGITTDRLGKSGVTSARNKFLIQISQYVRTSTSGRVVEALATGIPTVLRTVREAGMVPPRFYDQGIKFTVLMPNHALLASDDLQWLGRVTKGAHLSDTQRHVLVRMRHGEPLSNKSLREVFPMDSRDATKLLSDLVESGLAEAHGERGQRVYQLSSALVGNGHDGIEAATDISEAESSRSQGLIVDALESGPASRAEIQMRTGLTERQAQYALQSLRERGYVEMEGGRGRRTTYRLTRADEPA